jgi:hypothetical protein
MGVVVRAAELYTVFGREAGVPARSSGGISVRNEGVSLYIPLLNFEAGREDCGLDSARLAAACW